MTARHRLLPITMLLMVSTVVWGASPAKGDESGSETGTETFERHIYPIFRAHCFDCHGADEEVQGGLDLRLRRFLVAGGDSGPAITPGEADESFLVQRIRDGDMPPGDTKVSTEELAVLERWVDAGAPTARPEPDEIGPGIGMTEEEREFWSFQPIRRPELPSFRSTDHVRTSIDALLLEAMRPHGLSFSADAEKIPLLRRAYLDLTGLPPTPEQIQEFLDDDSATAYEQLIDDLLESPHYGERWGRHWLDVAGYADSEGYSNDDRPRNYAYKYRDYVIRSLNADKPFDQFIVEQLAGDELLSPPYSNLDEDQIEKLVATGFLRMAADGTGGGGVDQEEARNQVLADTIRIVSSSLLGMSVACAQCHDHRYDPIPQADYYRLRAVLEPALNLQAWRNPAQRQVSLYTDAEREEAARIEAEAAEVAAERSEKQKRYIAAALEKELEKLEEAVRDPLREAFHTPPAERSDEQRQWLKDYPSINFSPGHLYQYDPEGAEDLKTYDQRISEIRARKPPEDFVRALTEVSGQIPETRRLHRGDSQQPREQVLPGDLTVTARPGERIDIAADNPDLPTSGRRLAYARALTSGNNPLVARVLVNRVWMHHFGRGIVATPADFGRMGTPPTHPELLDWLADDFMQHGWSLKRLHRLIMTSTAYRQSSWPDAEKQSLDPENRWYWRWSVRRLEAEAIRDRILAASGQLSPRMFGPPVPIKADEAGQVVVDGEETRRSIYLQVRRTQPVGLLTAFDAPVMETNCEVRSSSTVSTQSLMLMNSDFALAQAGHLARRIERESSEPAAQLQRAWNWTLARPATPEEIEIGLEFLEDQVAFLRTQHIESTKSVASEAEVAETQTRETSSLESEACETETGLDSSDGTPAIDDATRTAWRLQALTNLCQTLFSSNEFLYVD
jgi:mono/diheme cytochrome c family protein